MKNIIERIAGGGAKIARYLPKAVSTRLAVAALAALAAGGAWATATKTNPVTSETETYVNTYTGTNGSWNSADNWDTGSIPYVSGGVYTSALVDGGGTETVVTGTSIDGWEMKLGVYGGAKVTISGLAKWTGGNGADYATVDATSKLTIMSMSGNNWNHVVNYYVASSGGITYKCAFAPANDAATIQYNLAGNGSVVYESTVNKAGHLIKMADVTLTGTSQVLSKTLVSFASTTKTFTADAAIKVYGTDGTTLATTVNLATVNTTGSTTLTTSDPVGTVELVQTSTGVVLYYVDGDPADVNVKEKTYKPSISVNFTSGTALSTAGDVGLAGYAVPGPSWNNLAVENNATLSPLNKIDSTGAATASSASVTITNTRGEWHCSSLVATSDMRAGYIDETADVTTPTVTVSGIPYDQYRVVVYTATDAANVKFGYVTINGTNYTYSDGAVAEGTTAWGASGAQNTAEALAEGVNVLVSPVVSGGTLTVVGHRSGNNPRGCIAAVQIVKVDQQVGENDLLIELDGDETYTFNAAEAYSGTVYVTGEGTLTFDGAASTAATLHIGPAAAVNMVGSALTPAAVTGNGTAVYDGAKPTIGLGWADSANWQGTLWVTNCSSFTQVLPNTVVNANSILRLTDCSGYFNNNDNAQSCDGTLELVDGNSAAFTVSDGYSSSGMTTFAKLIGDGTLTHSKGAVHQRYVFTDPSEFKGTINIPAGTETYGTGNNRPLRVILGNYGQLDITPSQGSITIAPGATATVASGKTWTAAGGGIAVYGTLNVNGTLAVSSDATTAASGSGTVVFTGRAPTPTGDAWWKNANWTGTVEIKDVANMIGASSGFTGTYLDFASYGNAESKIKISNISGWLPNQTFDGELVLAGTLTINNAISGYVFKVKKLSGNGGITSNTSNNSATTTFQAEDPSAFAGFLGIRYKRVVFGSSLPEGDFVHGQIYVGEGVVVTNQYNANNAWWATGGIKVDGELCSPNLTRFGGTTTITTTDTGVFTLVSNSDTDDMNVDYTRIQGTGTLKYEGSNYRTISTNNFPTALVVENNLGAGLIHRNNGQTVSIGSLSGSGQMRSDWNGSGSTGDRDLRILQAKDTTYSGPFASSNDRINDVYVAPGASTAGTLTLSGTQTASNGLIVESGAKVNLTGTWKGNTTVAGTFGGTGTLTGNLTFSDGATFKAFASDENGLAVRGYVEFLATDGEPVTVDLSGITLSGSGTTLITTTDGTINDISKLSVSGAVLALESDDTVLKAYPVASITIGGETTACASLDAAQTAALLSMPPYGSTAYDYITVYQSTTLASFQLDGLKIKKASGDVVVTITAPSAEFSVTQGDADENGIITCALSNAPTTYTWTDAYNQTGAGDEVVPNHEWTAEGNWGYGSGVTATRYPVAGDTVVFNDGATVTLGGNAACAAMTVNGAASISGAYNLTVSGNVTGGTGTPVLSLTGAKLSLSASSTVSGISLVLADANATLVVPSGATVVPVPTTSVAGCVVKATTVDGTTTYSVVAKGFFFMTY